MWQGIGKPAPIMLLHTYPLITPWKASQMVTTTDQAYRRAGGRRRYNKQRQVLALMRRLCILHHLHTRGYQLGSLSALAEEWGVHRSTISRDVRWLLGWKKDLKC
jgi:transcriptional antiterminator